MKLKISMKLHFYYASFYNNSLVSAIVIYSSRFYSKMSSFQSVFWQSNHQTTANHIICTALFVLIVQNKTKKRFNNE